MRVIPSRGFGVRLKELRSTWLAWGASSLVTGRTGLTSPGTGGKSAGREKLNHERPDRKGLSVSLAGDGAELRTILVGG